MKKIAVSVGLAAVGTAGLHAAYTPGLDSMQTSKVWSVSGSLRGFYDSNYNTEPNGPNKRDSFGFEVSPSITANIPLDQTDIGLRYTYGLYYYQDREDLNQKPIDQTHQFDFWLDHAFSENWKGTVQDSVVVGQQPQLLDGGTFLRANGNNLVNTGSIKLDTQWTRLTSTELGYQNTYVNYSNDGGNAVNPSLSGLLDRVENLVWLNFYYEVTPTIKPYIGAQYGQINYTGDEVVALDPVTGKNIVSDNRDSRSYYGYVGVQYNPLANLTFSLQGGVQYVDYYNPQAGLSSDNELDPYANLSATYTYLPGSYVQVGFTQSQNATDIITPNANNGRVTQSQDSSTFYAQLNHQITAKLTANLLGKIQYSTFNGGQYDGDSQTWYNFGAGLSYAINNHLSADVRYDYYNLNSQLPASVAQNYNRNIVSIGITGTY